MYNPTTNIKNPLLGWLYVLAIVGVAFVLPFYRMVTNTGLWLVLVRFQGKTFGVYYPMITFFACVLVNLACVLGVLVLLALLVNGLRRLVSRP